jgi:serine protease Do
MSGCWPPAIRELLAAGGLACWFATGALAAETAPAAPEPAATTTTALKPAEVAPDAPDTEPALPAVFSKRVPEGADDLREMETHLQSLADKLTNCTVNLQIGPAQGSGVIVTADGYILTAAHVSGRPGRRVDVYLPDGTHVTGTTYGRDDMLDAGLIKLNSGNDWPHAEMAPADSIQYGEWCLATGHPGGLHDGRAPVLRLGRVIFATKRVIQTDCELVGGDSGGPLFDMHGRVIGINSRISEDTDHNFHAPIAAYTGSWDRLVASESFQSHSGALLGVSGVPHERGLKITTVHPDDPAERAGVIVGDVLLTFGGRKVTSIEQLTELVGRYAPRRNVDIEVLRDGRTIQKTVRLGFRIE